MQFKFCEFIGVGATLENASTLVNFFIPSSSAEMSKSYSAKLWRLSWWEPKLVFENIHHTKLSPVSLLQTPFPSSMQCDTTGWSVSNGIVWQKCPFLCRLVRCEYHRICNNQPSEKYQFCFYHYPPTIPLASIESKRQGVSFWSENKVSSYKFSIFVCNNSTKYSHFHPIMLTSIKMEGW